MKRVLKNPKKLRRLAADVERGVFARTHGLDGSSCTLRSPARIKAYNQGARAR